MQKLTQPEVLDAFKNFVRLERELVALLRAALARDAAMLSSIAGEPVTN